MFFFFNDTATTEIYTLSLHDALPILGNSASSSKNNTPLLARLISPRDEFAPPPIIEILVVVWCGCLKGLVFTKPPLVFNLPAAEYILLISKDSLSFGLGSIFFIALAIIVLPVPGGPTITIL